MGLSKVTHNKRMQMDRPKRYALVSATDAKRYVASKNPRTNGKGL